MPVRIQDTLAILKRLQDSAPQLREQLLRVQQDVSTFAQEQETERNKLLDTINQQQSQIAQLQASLTARQKENTEQARVIDELKKRLETVGTTSVATPLSLANSFKGVIDSIQAEARKTPGSATTIKDMVMEIKGLVQVQQDKVTMVLPNVGAPVDASALSTLRVSFGAVPVAAPEPPSR